MFRVPLGKWPVSDLSQNASCDTSNHIRMQKQVQWRIHQVPRTTLVTSGHVPGAPGGVASFWLGTKPIMRHLKSHSNAKINAMEDISSAQDHTGQIRTCYGYPRGSGQFLRRTKTYHATPKIILECKNKCNGGYIKYPGPHWTHPDMFREPPGKWPVSDLEQNPSCDTSNHIRMQKLLQWCLYQVTRTQASFWTSWKRRASELFSLNNCLLPFKVQWGKLKSGVSWKERDNF